MFADLDMTLKTLLELELSHVIPNTEISFETPAHDFKPNPPCIDLFLYDVRENRELRSNEWITERQNNDLVIKKRPPVRVECSYLITAWAGAGAGNARDEHQILGEVMKVLLRHPTIPAQVLQGALIGQEPPLPAVSLQPGRLQSLGEFWQALGGTPKVALNYTVTIGVEAHKPEETKLVTEKMLKFDLSK